jgi:hypothetical protein
MEQNKNKVTKEMLEKASELLSKIEDPELHQMIEKLDATPIPLLQFDADDYIKIYNWLKELELYKKFHGPLGGYRR